MSNCSASTSGRLDLSSPIHSIFIPRPPLVWRAGRPGGSAVSSSSVFDSIRGRHGVMDAFLPAEPHNGSRGSNLCACGLRSRAFRSSFWSLNSGYSGASPVRLVSRVKRRQTAANKRAKRVVCDPGRVCGTRPATQRGGANHSSCFFSAF